MELKYSLQISLSNSGISSNCTFMELKSPHRSYRDMKKNSSNCTFMELKYRLGAVLSKEVLF